MTRVVLCLAVSLVGTVAVRVQGDETITLTFDSPVEGTLKDKSGDGTGFTHRVPGWGTLIQEDDPNLDLSANPGYLTITTNQASAYEWPENLEALGVLVPNVGQRDFTVSGKFHDIQFQTAGQSDQLMLYVAASASKYMQMGYHKDYSPGHGPTVSQYAGNSYDLPSVVLRFQETPANWQNGDDGIITLSRTSGSWTFSWSDLTNGDSGTSPSFEVPELWDQEDLYFGILYATVYNDISKTSQIDEFSVTVVPEPSTLILLSMGALALLVYACRRRQGTFFLRLGRCIMRGIVAVGVFLTMSCLVHPQEVIVVDSKDDNPAYSSPLIDGQWYQLEASGTYRWSIHGFRADAEWLQQWNPELQPGWDDREEYLEDGHDPERRFWGMELLVNGEDRDWMGTTDGTTFLPHVFSSDDYDHVYRQYIHGTGDPVSFDIQDWPGAPGNAGSLQVKISPLPIPVPEPPIPGKLHAWGGNDYGQCEVSSGDDYIDIAAGWIHSLALRADGSLVSWGAYNSVPEGNDFVDISAGERHSVALKADGTVDVWGDNSSDQLNIPLGLADVTAVEAGEFHSVALKNDGTLAAWGWNQYQQLEIPSEVQGHVQEIASGGHHTLALKIDGSLAAWGRTDEGQCDVPSGNDFVSIGVGNYHSFAIREDGSYEAWGDNTHEELDVPDGSYQLLTGGKLWSVGLQEDGSLAAWGINNRGQHGVPDESGFVAIAAGHSHGLAITAAPGKTILTSVDNGNWHDPSTWDDGTVAPSDILSVIVSSHVVTVVGNETAFSLLIDERESSVILDAASKLGVVHGTDVIAGKLAVEGTLVTTYVAVDAGVLDVGGSGVLDVLEGFIQIGLDGAAKLNLRGGSVTAKQVGVANGTTTQTGGIHHVGEYLSVGMVQSSTGTYELSGDGQLQAADQYVGDAGTGEFLHVGGTNTVNGVLSIGAGPDSEGTYELRGSGELSANWEVVGGYGVGRFVHTAGSNVIVQDLSLGQGPGGDGTYHLGGTGQLSAYFEAIGEEGTGWFEQWGGTNTVDFVLRLAGWDGSTGTYELSGSGQLSAEFELIGSKGIGHFIQTGGANAILGDLSVGHDTGGDGTYHLGGTGHLSANKEFIGFAGTGRFVQTGGSNLICEILRIGYEPGSHGTYTISGGSLTTSDLSVEVGGLEIADSAAQITVSNKLFLGEHGTLTAVPGATIHMTGSTFENQSVNPSALAGLSDLTLTFEGGKEDIDPVEVAGWDIGPVLAGFQDNFALGTLQLGGADVGMIQLVDDFDNRPDWDGNEALYVWNLNVGPSSHLDLSGLNLYFLNGDIDPTATIVGGTPTLVPEPSTVTLSMLGMLLLSAFSRCCLRRPA